MGSVSGGRLECTMQNIADNLVNSFSSQCFEGVEGIMQFVLLLMPVDYHESYPFSTNFLYTHDFYPSI